jgi:hypothetical protein
MTIVSDTVYRLGGLMYLRKLDLLPSSGKKK